MNAIEIEAAITDLAARPFDSTEFPYAFLTAFGNKEPTIKRLRTGETNKSDLGGVLQVKNIHILVASQGEVHQGIEALKASPATAKGKVRFILVTDGIDFEAEDLESNDPPVVCAYKDFPNHFWLFLPLAGITTVKQIRDNALDIRAANRLNRLYVELLKTNPEWGAAGQRAEMNHFMARLIFCFFAEDTGIFQGESLFTETVERMSASDSSNTHEIIHELFRAMNLRREDRIVASLPRWADLFPYVNGHLFTGNIGVPRFSKIARSYLLHVGRLEWTKINPDIFGSMIQAVADEEERGAVGMHYTSVPNILKVLNPLFLDNLREQLAAAGHNHRALLNLKKRISKIRIFDPACGSGNFLVIAYKQLREIEHEINVRRDAKDTRSEIPLTNFRGIELNLFPVEIARLALIIAEYQCNQLYLGQQEALAVFLPLESKNWITHGNALRLDWLSICPPTGKGTEGYTGELFEPITSHIDFENEGGETYICGNPPFTGTRKQSAEQKRDLESVFSGLTKQWKNVDYVGAWFLKAAEYNRHCSASFAFVATNSLCQGQQVPITWAILYSMGMGIRFAVRPFKWDNLASNKAGVTVIIAGLDSNASGARAIYTGDTKSIVDHINPYLTAHRVDIVQPLKRPAASQIVLEYGVYYSKSAGLIVSAAEVGPLRMAGVPNEYLREFLGSHEFINGELRYCLWISDEEKDRAISIPEIADRIDSVRHDRLATDDLAVRKLAEKPHQFREFKGDQAKKIFVPIVSSESREYFPAGLVGEKVIATNKAFYAPIDEIWPLAIILSKLHLVWIGTICGRLEMRYSYSNTLGWNTFPMPTLTEKNKVDLTRCAEDVLLAREAHFPATIADLYDPECMPSDLKAAHERNDEVLESIYIGRRFRNDTERLEKLFDLYTKMAAANKSIPKVTNKRKLV